MNTFKKFLILLVCIASMGFPALASGQNNYTWKSVPIGGGGFVTGIVYSQAQSGLAYCRTDVGGAYRWEASAQRWIPLTDQFGGDDWSGRTATNWSLQWIESIAADPTDANRVYLAAGGSIDWSWAQALLISRDKGDTWTRVTPPFRMAGNNDGRSNGERLMVDPNSPNVLFFGSRADGLFRSADYGATWTKIESFPVSGSGQSGEIGIVFVHAAKANGSSGSPTPLLYAGVNQAGFAGLYLSTDAGTTWAAVPGQPVTMIAQPTKRAMPHRAALDQDGTLYLTYGDAPGPNSVGTGEVWKYDPHSGAWTNISPTGPNVAQGGYSGLSVDTQHPGTVVVSTIDRWWPGDTVYRTSNGGQTWTDLNASDVHTADWAPWIYWHRPVGDLGWGNWIGDIQINPFNPDDAMYVTGGGIFGTTDLTAADSGQSTHWIFRAQNIEEAGCWGSNKSLFSPPPIPGSKSVGVLYSAMGDIDGFRWANLEQSPPAGQHNPAHGSNTSIAYAAGNPLIMARTHYGTTRGSYSTDGGMTWTDFASCPSVVSASSDPGVITVSADGAALVWSGVGCLPYYSLDAGVSWTASTGIPAPAFNWLKYGPTADPVDPATFYLYEPNTGYVYRSTNQGASFSVSNQGLPAWGDPMNAAPGRVGDLWQPTGSGLYHSTDGGRTYSQINDFVSARCIGFGRAAPGQSYPAAYAYGRLNGFDGIFRSDDAGVSWVRINDEMHRWGWVSNVTGDPRIYGRCYVSARGILYGDLPNANPNVPTIIQQPKGDLIARGRNHSLSVFAIGAAPLKYQWFEQPAGSHAVKAIPGANQASYTATSVRNSTSYWVNVSNASGFVASAKATVMVANPAAPSILSKPADLSVASGQSATFSVAATGLPTALSYQWQIARAGSSNWVSLADDATYSGTTSSILKISPALRAMDGDRFQVVVSNGVPPAAVSTLALLSVQPAIPPSILIQPASTFVAYHWPATLSVTATGTAPFAYQWYRGGSGDISQPITGQTADTYKTPDLVANVSYWVQVRNDSGLASSATATVTVLAPAAPANGSYKLVNRQSGFLLEVVAHGLANGAMAALATDVDGANQKWTLTSLGGGQYQILGLESGLSLDVYGWSSSNGSTVGLWTYGGGANQHWTLSDLGNGYFAITTGNSGLGLAIANQSSSAGAGLVQWAFEMRQDQQWSLVPAP